MTGSVDQALIIRMEASLARFERQMNRGRQIGVRTATDIERRFDRMGTRMATSSARAASGLTRITNISGSGRFVLQNTAAQLGDIAVQLESGTSASRVMGQQLPQLLGGFGALGGTLGVLAPLLGTVAAIGIPVAAALLMVGRDANEADEELRSFEEAVGAAESALARMDAALDRIGPRGEESLLEMYGELNAAIDDLARRLAEIETRAVQIEVQSVVDQLFGEDYQAEIDALFGSIGRVFVANNEDAIANLSAQISALDTDISNMEGTGAFVPPSLRADLVAMREELAFLNRDLANAGSLAGEIELSPDLLDQIAAAETALRSAAEAGDFAAVADAAAEMGALLEQAGAAADSDLYDGLSQAESQARVMVARLREAEEAADGLAGVDIASGVYDAGREAANLARWLGVSLETARRLASFGPQGVPGSGRGVGGGRGGDPRNSGGAFIDWQTRDAQRFLESYERPRERGRGGGRDADDLQELLASGEREITQLQRRIELIGRTESEVAGLQARYRLLDEAQKRNLDLNERQAESGMTLREEIDQHAAAVERLTERYQQAEARAQFYEQTQQKVRDGVLDAIVEGENLVGVLSDVAKAFARAALEAAIFGTGPFAGGFGGGKSGGGFFGSLFAGFFDEGGRIPAGQFGVAGEHGPEIVRGPAQVVSRASTARLLSSNIVQVSPTISIDARGAQRGVAEEIDAALAARMPALRSMAVQAVEEARGRGRLA